MSDLRQTAIAHLKFKGAMTLIQLDRAIGFSAEGCRVSERTRNLVRKMEAEGIITIAHVQPSGSLSQHDQIKLVTDEPAKPPKSAGTGWKPGQCTSYIDESIKGSWKPPPEKKRQQVSDRDIEVELERESRLMRCKEETELTAKEEEAQPLTALETHLKKFGTCNPTGSTADRLSHALEELIAEGKPFAVVDVCRKAGLGETAIYHHREILDRAKEAIDPSSMGHKVSESRAEKLQQRQQAAESRVLDVLQQFVERGQPFTQADVGAMAGVSLCWFKRNKEIRSLVKEAIERLKPAKSAKEVEQVKPKMATAANSNQNMNDQAFISRLQAEAAQLRLTIERIEAEERQLAEDKLGAIESLQACMVLINRLTGDEPQFEMQLVHSVEDRRGVA